ncbi:VOC family protein [Pseudomonas sp. SL4(2022)]|uniref:VOC family protein n=1 Tax=unclassified Pseudomonas TaxID=196821 RepID=UPI001C442B63|nr:MULTISPECIES: VOC family protein [unclassified Pseudomonas]WAC45957.1 VOC family protein [Pseudomonas sp. SL4(2022)]
MSTKAIAPVAFDWHANVGLHHLALLVESEAQLEALHRHLIRSGTRVEFSPDWVKQGPAQHLMCFDPSGIRIEFFWPGV